MLKTSLLGSLLQILHTLPDLSIHLLHLVLDHGMLSWHHQPVIQNKLRGHQTSSKSMQVQMACKDIPSLVLCFLTPSRCLQKLGKQHVKCKG